MGYREQFFPQAGRNGEHEAASSLSLDLLSTPLAEGSTPTLCHVSSGRVKLFVGDCAVTAAYQSNNNPGPPVPQLRSFLGVQVVLPSFTQQRLQVTQPAVAVQPEQMLSHSSAWAGVTARALHNTARAITLLSKRNRAKVERIFFTDILLGTGRVWPEVRD